MNRLMLPGHMKTAEKKKVKAEKTNTQLTEDVKATFEPIILARSKKLRHKQKQKFDLLHSKDQVLSNTGLKVDSLASSLPSAKELGLDDFEEKEEKNETKNTKKRKSQTNKTSKKKKKLTLKERTAEITQFSNVLNHPAFQLNPLATIKEHVENVNKQELKQLQDQKKQVDLLGLKPIKSMSKKKHKKKKKTNKMKQ